MKADIETRWTWHPIETRKEKAYVRLARRRHSSWVDGFAAGVLFGCGFTALVTIVGYFIWGPR